MSLRTQRTQERVRLLFHGEWIQRSLEELMAAMKCLRIAAWQEEEEEEETVTKDVSAFGVAICLNHTPLLHWGNALLLLHTLLDALDSVCEGEGGKVRQTDWGVGHDQMAMEGPHVTHQQAQLRG